MSDGRHIENR